MGLIYKIIQIFHEKGFEVDLGCRFKCVFKLETLRRFSFPIKLSATV